MRAVARAVQAAAFVTAASISTLVCAGSAAIDGAKTRSTASVSVQIDNPDQRTSIRVTLDGAVIFEGLPVSSTVSNIPLLTSAVGPFELLPGTHTLVAEALVTGIKARLDWMPTPATTSWVVIHYVPTASGSAEPTHLRFSLQPRTYKLR